MPTSYTSLLGLALPVTGELAGTWGDTVNDYITQYVDASVAGTQTISGSQTAVTLSVTTGSSLTQVGSGSTGSAQYSIINCTGNPASTLTVTVPSSSREYLVLNATSTNQSVVIKGAATTGVTLVAGEKAVIAWNGSDFTKVVTSVASGVTSISFGSTGLTPSTGTAGAVTVAGTLATASGGTGLTTFAAANNAIYSTSSSALTAGTLPVLAGGTGSTTAAGARTNLGATTVGGNLFTLTNPSAVTFPRFNADNTVSALDAATFRTAIGAGTGDVTLSGTQTLTNKTLVSPTLNGVTMTGVLDQTGSVRGNITPMAALDIDCSTGNYFTKTISTNSTFTVSNVPSSRVYAFTLELTYNGGTITWFSGVQWPGNVAPTLTTSRVNLFTFVTDDGGVIWRGVSSVNYVA